MSEPPPLPTQLPVVSPPTPSEARVWPSGAPRRIDATATRPSAQTQPASPILSYAPRRTVEPPPLPKRVIAYVTAIDKNSSTAIWSTAAVVIGVVLVGAMVYRATVIQPAQEAIAAEKVERFLPIRAAVEKANLSGLHPLDDSIWFRRAYIQHDLIIRYQVNANHLEKEGLELYISYLKEKSKFLRALASEADSEEALRLASAIYLDVYDRNGEWLYSYNLLPSDIWADAVDPEPI